MKINKENIQENIKRFDHDYKVKDKVMLDNNDAFKYDTPYKGPFQINQCWKNDTVALQRGTIKIRYNVGRIKPYTYDTNIEDIKC